MKTPLLSLIIVTLVAAALPATHADECRPSTSAATAIQTAGVTFYVTTSNGATLYQESNDIDGLQRADGFKDDTCGGFIPADRHLL